MPIARLTQPTIGNLRPIKGQSRSDYFDERTPALCLRVGPRRKTWMLNVRVLREGSWKLTRVTLGHWPAMGLSEARRQAARTRDQIEQGADRVAAARSKRETLEEQSCTTFAVARKQFLEAYPLGPRRPAPRTIAETERLLKSRDLDVLADRPITAITRRDIRECVEAIAARGAPVAANRTLSTLGRMFQWALDQELISIDPTSGLKPPAAEQSRTRVLTRDEIAAIWRATADDHVFSNLVRFLLLTGQRRGEIASAKFDHIADIAGIHCLQIPAENAKNRRNHLVPLALPALAIIKRQERFQSDHGFIFQSQNGYAFSGWTAKPRLDAKLDIAPWTLHDLRRTLVTVMNEDLKIQPHIVEAVVNHMTGRSGVAGVYNRALHLSERRAALDAYARWVLEAAKG